jgi:hypothetical protein
MTTANENRRIKGLAQDKLKQLGFNNVFVTDCGSNIITVYDDRKRINELENIVIGTRYKDKMHTGNNESFFIKL